MPRPSKGARVAINLRIPFTLAAEMARRQLADRNAFIVQAITEKLERDD